MPGSRRVRRRTAATGSVTAFGHSTCTMSATYPPPAVSVHAYSPPLSAMRRYEMTEPGLRSSRTERAELDW